jgi:CBS domain containing-hemolysin-like protein
LPAAADIPLSLPVAAGLADAGGLIAALLLVVGNGFFVASEFALARLRPTQVDEWVEEGRPGARSTRHAIDHIDNYLAACQLGITLASLGLGVVGEPAFHHLLEPIFGEGAEIAGAAVAGILAFSLITLLHVVVGELAPKSLAIARTERMALLLMPPMRLFYTVTRPIVDFFNMLGNLLLKPFGVPPASESGHVPHSERELRALLRQSSEEGLIQDEERRFTENALLFGDRRAREIMTPRPKVDYVTTDESLEDAARTAASSGHTRLPLCEPDGGLDAPVGVIHAKDLLAALLDDERRPLTDIARPLERVSEATLIDQLLRELRRSRQHIALVADEHGTTVGLVTLEDILEEIVGEIEDEFDERVHGAIRREGDVVIVDGDASLRLVSEEIGLGIDTHHEATIGGHILETLGREPEPGEKVMLGDVEAEVTKVGDATVEEVRFEKAESGKQKAERD